MCGFLRETSRSNTMATSDIRKLWITGVTLRSKHKIRDFYSDTRVRFKELTEQEIRYYIEHFKPYDKAGAYGIQEWIGYIGIEKIEGSYYNVMGLPVQKLYQELENFIT